MIYQWQIFIKRFEILLIFVWLSCLFLDDFLRQSKYLKPINRSAQLNCIKAIHQANLLIQSIKLIYKI